MSDRIGEFKLPSIKGRDDMSEIRKATLKEVGEWLREKGRITGDDRSADWREHFGFYSLSISEWGTLIEALQRGEMPIEQGIEREG